MIEVEEIGFFEAVGYPFKDLLYMGEDMPKWSVYQEPGGGYCVGVRFATEDSPRVFPVVLQAVQELMRHSKDLSLRIHLHSGDFEPKFHEGGIEMRGITAVTMVWR